MIMADTSLERLKLLYDYEKFHIGLYGAMITGFIAIMSLWSQHLTWVMFVALAFAVLFLLAAAVCGATLASSAIDVYGNYRLWTSATHSRPSLDNFWNGKIGPYRKRWWKAEVWWRIGHTSFWVSVFLVVGTFLGHVVWWSYTGQLWKGAGDCPCP
jgi:hypothetical protein